MMKVTNEEIIKAYRKVKVHLYQQRNQPRLLKLWRFEQDLQSNLDRLRKNLNQSNFDGIVNQCKGYCIIPYRQSERPQNPDLPVFVDSQHPESSGSEVLSMVFSRTLADLPVECEIVFAIWVMRIGHCVDAALPEYVVGDRLYRSTSGEFDSECSQMYQDYNRRFIQCQRDISACLRRALADGRNFLLCIVELRDRAAYASALDHFKSALIDLNVDLEEHKQLTDLICSMIQKWGEFAAEISQGIPLGSCVSGVVSNTILSRVDIEVQNKMQPFLYRRCGKVVAIAVEQNGYESPEAFYKEVFSCLKESLSYTADNMLQTDRSRVCKLTGASGIDLLEAFERAMDENDIVWNLLPEFSDDPDTVHAMHSPVSTKSGDCGLQQLSRMALSRKRFVKQINDMELYLTYLGVDAWERLRVEFLRTIRDTYCDARSIFDYFPFYSRILAIAFACSRTLESAEYGIAMSIIQKVSDVLNSLRGWKLMETAPDVDIQAFTEKWADCMMRDFFMAVVERLCASVQSDIAKKRLLSGLKARFGSLLERLNVETEGLPTYQQLQNTDLADVAFKDCAQKYAFRGKRLHSNAIQMCPEFIRSAIPRGVVEDLSLYWCGLTGEADSTAGNFPLALYLATRGLDQVDLSVVVAEKLPKDACARTEAILRCFRAPKPVNCAQAYDESGMILIQRFPSGREEVGKVRLGLVSWKTEEASWKAMVYNSADPNLRDRFRRLCQIFNQVIVMPPSERPQYLLFPELALHPMHYLLVARKMAREGVSLIAGVDYIHHHPRSKSAGLNAVTNEVWCSLCLDASGGRAVIVRCIKSRPAQDEEQNLYKLNGSVMLSAAKRMPQKIIVHGQGPNDFMFGILICSDVLNIDFRTRLRGNVDMLIVPAWNKDVPTYSALIESAAMDVHAYVALVNSRAYGDTRLRAPAKEHYDRDIVRLRGGTRDFVVVGEVDIAALREFQSQYRSPDKPFKPIPIGYEISPFRIWRP